MKVREILSEAPRTYGVMLSFVAKWKLWDWDRNGFRGSDTYALDVLIKCPPEEIQPIIKFIKDTKKDWIDYFATELLKNEDRVELNSDEEQTVKATSVKIGPSTTQNADVTYESGEEFKKWLEDEDKKMGDVFADLLARAEKYRNKQR